MPALCRLLQNAQEAVEETRSLRTRVQLADAAAAQAKRIEQDYEQVVTMLEKEISKLRTRNMAQKMPEVSYSVPLLTNV